MRYFSQGQLHGETRLSNVRLVPEDAMAGRDDPLVGDEGAAARDAFADQLLLDDGHLPWVPAELRVLAADDAVAARVHFAAFCKKRYHSVGPNSAHLHRTV